MYHKSALLFKKVRGVLCLSDVKRVAGTFGLACLLSGSPLQAQTFAPVQINPFGLDTAATVGEFTLNFADFDGDGDLDFITWSYDYYSGDEANRFVENIGTPESPQYISPAPISIGSGVMLFMTPVDIDADGDFDLISAGYDYDNNVYFAENSGTSQSPGYKEVVGNEFGIEATDGSYIFPTFADLDGDGDLDMVVVGEDFVKFSKNIGTAQSAQFDIAEPLELNFPIDAYMITPEFADLDMDGDMDLFISGYIDSNGSYFPKLYYSENIGTPTEPNFADVTEDVFGLELNLSGFGGIPTFADFDNDGDEDLMLLMINDGEEFEYHYFENLGTSGTNQPKPRKINVFPNPTSGIVYFENMEEIELLSVFDATGKQVLEKRNPGNSVSVASLPKGFYSLHTVFSDGTRGMTKITKQ